MMIEPVRLTAIVRAASPNGMIPSNEAMSCQTSTRNASTSTSRILIRSQKAMVRLVVESGPESGARSPVGCSGAGACVIGAPHPVTREFA